jgi:hypothetical protein
MIPWELVLAGSAGMALLAATVDAALPRSRKAWWHARPRQAFARRDEHAPALTTVAPEVHCAAPLSALQVVESADRRGTQLPFVGRDRRKAERAAARQRRTANDR